MKLKSEQNNFKQIYKYQILSTNKSYFYYNNIYKQLMKKLNENEEKRLNFLKTNLEMFCHETELISNKTDLFIKEFITKLSSWTIEREKKNI
jgi:energy-converting hydrogenase A subunit M